MDCTGNHCTRSAPELTNQPCHTSSSRPGLVDGSLTPPLSRARRPHSGAECVGKRRAIIGPLRFTSRRLSLGASALPRRRRLRARARAPPALHRLRRRVLRRLRAVDRASLANHDARDSPHSVEHHDEGPAQTAAGGAGRPRDRTARRRDRASASASHS